MIKKSVQKEIDKSIKEIWLNEICEDYGNGFLIKEASLQCSFYYHLRNRLKTLLKESNLYLYPEVYFKDLKYYADLAIVEMNMDIECSYLADKLTDVAAIIELKYDSGSAVSTSDYIKTDKTKIRKYVQSLGYNCQYYFGVIYETECEWLNWFDKRSTKNWADGCLTELNAGYLNDRMFFEVNSYNNINVQNKRVSCNIHF